jgi:choline dehydrogenase-like flavoprotein
MSELVRGERPGLTGAEQRLRIGAGLLGLISVAFAVWYLVKGLTAGSEFPFVVNSVAKDALLAGLCALIIADVRRWATVAVPLLVAAHVLMPLVMVATALWGNTDAIDHTWIAPPDTGAALRTNWFLGDVVVVAGLVGLHWMAVRSRYDLRYLPPSAFKALMALAEVLVLRKDREIAPAEVAGRVDRYLASFRATGKWKVRLALVGLAYYPLLLLRPPLYVMSVDARQHWLQKRFLDDVSRRGVPEFVRSLRQAMIRAAQQFCFMGYYGDDRAARKAGYLPFSQRPGATEAIANVRHSHDSVTCMMPADIPGEDLTADIVVVGSGAAGATLAYELARRGREVLVLERGPHVDPRDFTEDEATQLSNLYADGALTLSTDFRFQVAQGMCVGGSTVVNNAVCFDLPQRVLDRWLDRHAAGLDPARLALAFLRMRRFLRVAELGPTAVMNPGARRFVDGLGGRVPWSFKIVECNIADCLGSGYCNIGCAHGKKLSALDWTLPRAQREHPDAVRILPDCRVEKVLLRDKIAYGVQARTGDGRRLTVRANKVVLSAGAIASSLILQRSGLGDGRAGRGLAFNMASPVTLDFHEELHSERGAQITHYIEPQDPGHEGIALESWFNPIVSQSLFMPGWFEQHWDNMRRYANMTCLGVVAGTGNDATVKAARLLGGVTLDYTPSDADFIKLKEGLRLACELGLDAGAERVMPATFQLLELRDKDELWKLDNAIGDSSDVSINSAHPQGGNPMSADARRGVVDPEFRVNGALEVYVCDASVFPSSITVNPQLTVMALAEYAADHIAGRESPGEALLQERPRPLGEVFETERL